jgi:hypothetical protein
MFAAMRRASSFVIKLAAERPARLVLVVHIRERVAVPILHNEARVVTIFDGPGRREAALVT